MKCKRGYGKEKGKCVKNKTYFNKKNSVNWDAMWIIVTVFGMVILGSVLFYGGGQGWFKSLTVIENTDLISYLDTPNHQIDYSCSLDISPGSIYVGDRTTGTIVGGPNSLCQVFANDGTQWLKIYEGYTDANGVLVDTRNINTVGSFTFRAICDLNDNNRVDMDDCLTNPEELNVLPLPDDGSCSETDGGNVRTTPGITTSDGIGYMDYCLDFGEAVHEYWCDGGELMEENYACNLGDVCIDTRSGGYCSTPEVSYEVGDNVGSGASGSGTAEFGDDDSINVITMDWTTGGDYVLGAKITRSWDYVGEDCYGPEQYPMEWTFYDSNGMAWQEYDYLPVSNVVDYVCPVTYHEDAPWKFVVTTGIQACGVEYSWNVQPYICEMSN